MKDKKMTLTKVMFQVCYSQKLRKPNGVSKVRWNAAVKMAKSILKEG